MAAFPAALVIAAAAALVVAVAVAVVVVVVVAAAAAVLEVSHSHYVHRIRQFHQRCCHLGWWKEGPIRVPSTLGQRYLHPEWEYLIGDA